MSVNASKLPAGKWCLRLQNPYPVYGKAAPSEAATLSPQRSAPNLGARVLERYDQSRYLETIRKTHDDLGSLEGFLMLTTFRAWAKHKFVQPRPDDDPSSASTFREQISISKTGMIDGKSEFKFEPDRTARLQLLSQSDVSRISSTLVLLNHLHQMKAHSSVDIRVLYCFCDRRDRFRNDAASVLKTWLHQLMQQRPDITKDASDWISSYVERYLTLERPVVIWGLIRTVLKGSNPGATYCVLDGLHELDDRSITILLDLFDCELPLEGCMEDVLPLKVLVTSRGQLTSQKWMHIDLEPYINCSNALKYVPHDDNCNGTIPKYTTRTDDIHESDVIRDLLTHIAAYQNPPTIQQLQWVLERTNDELQQCIESCQPSIDITPAKLVSFRNSDAWSQYSASGGSTNIHSRLAHKCLDILGTGLAFIDVEDLKTDYQDWKDRIQPDLAYAIEQWAEHVKLSKDSTETMLNKLMTTFARNSPTVDKWWLCYVQMVGRVSQTEIRLRPHTTILHIFTYFGFHALLDTALHGEKKERFEECLDTFDCFGQNPLSLAILKNDFEMVNVLININVTVALKDLVYAAGSNIEIAKVVYQKYEHGKISLYRTNRILDRAVKSGDIELLRSTIQLLVSKSQVVFPWSETEHFSWAIDAGRWDIVQTVLLTITEFDSTIERIINYATASHNKTISCNLLGMKRVKRAIARQEISNVNALCAALEHKCPEMVRHLVTDKNINMKSIAHTTPLQIAVRHSNIHTIVHLLDNDTLAINRNSIEGGIALNLVLHSAITEVKIEYLVLVLQKGARMQYNHFGITALHVAAELGRPKVMNVLWEHLSDAEIETQIDLQCTSIHQEQGKEDFTALGIAATKGYVEIVRMLLHRGAKRDVLIRGKTAMELAGEAGHEDVVKVLGDFADKTLMDV